MLPLLVAMSDLVGLVGGFFVSLLTLHLNSVEFWHRAINTLDFSDLMQGLTKPLFFRIHSCHRRLLRDFPVKGRHAGRPARHHAGCCNFFSHDYCDGRRSHARYAVFFGAPALAGNNLNSAPNISEQPAGESFLARHQVDDASPQLRKESRILIFFSCRATRNKKFLSAKAAPEKRLNHEARAGLLQPDSSRAFLVRSGKLTEDRIVRLSPAHRFCRREGAVRFAFRFGKCCLPLE